MKNKYSAFFKAAGDTNRMKIMMLLMKQDLCVSDICKQFNMQQPSISHHLNVLKNAGVVTDRKEGKEVFYSLNRCCISSCCEGFMKKFFDKKE